MYALAYKMGLDPVNDLLDDQAKAFVSFINSWMRKIYPRFDWPEWTTIEQRTPSAHYVDFAQAGQSVIERVFKVYLLDPSTVQGVMDTPFKLNSKGIFVGFEHGSTVWIKYIGPAPQFTSVPWDSATTYAKDALSYEPTGGNCYVSLQASNTNHAPASNPTWWVLQAFPAEIVDLVVRGAYSDALREDGQTDKAQAEEQAVISEAQQKIASRSSIPYDWLTDQGMPPPRYHPPGATTGD
jgi:hypothetical protein